MEGQHKKSIIQCLQTWWYRIEDTILVTLLSLMILMAALQIFLRNLFDSGIVWGDSMIRILVLWVGLFGAMVASRKDEHIKIDLILRYIPEKIKPVVHLITDLFTAIVCVIVVFYGYRFVKFEFTDNLPAFSIVPAWVCESIIPISFAIIGIRYMFHFLHHFLQIMRPKP
jgi:TRAP-type C4-dicarboxylate transport system permease small subunit